MPILDLEEIKKEIKEEVLQWLYKEVKQPDKYLISIALGHAIRKTVERIRKACEFFLRYKDNPDLLMEKHPEYKKEIKKLKKVKLGCIINGRVYEEMIENPMFEKDYNEWLFRLAFKSIFKEKKE
mgnify:CR=1 FL=1